MSLVSEAAACLGQSNKPMAISSIISAPMDHDKPTHLTPTALLPSHYPSSTCSTSSSSLDDEPTNFSPAAADESCTPRHLYQQILPANKHHNHQLLSSDNNNASASFSHTTTSLSLQERRQRNKAASAKYRAKKNQQYSEMRNMIATLTKENELLSRQLEHVKRENSRLRSTCDRLRGKKVAAKILKRFLTSNSKQVHEQQAIRLDQGDESDQSFP